MNEMTCAALFPPNVPFVSANMSNILPYPGELIYPPPTEPRVSETSDPRGALPDGLGAIVV